MRLLCYKVKWSRHCKALLTEKWIDPYYNNIYCISDSQEIRKISKMSFCMLHARKMGIKFNAILQLHEKY